MCNKNIYPIFNTLNTDNGICIFKLADFGGFIMRTIIFFLLSSWIHSFFEVCHLLPNECVNQREWVTLASFLPLNPPPSCVIHSDSDAFSEFPALLPFGQSFQLHFNLNTKRRPTATIVYSTFPTPHFYQSSAFDSSISLPCIPSGIPCQSSFGSFPTFSRLDQTEYHLDP